MINKTMLLPIELGQFKQILTEIVREQLSQIDNNKDTESIEFITRKEASYILGVSLPTMSDWSKRGIVKAYRIGSRIRYKKSEILDSVKQIRSIKYKKGGQNA